ncbi:hypothetical protein GE061_001370 [Apolygus lucorum]|uniref:C3H1-type domain-containing protein n=1 Tax=Apolygus lucorum TaxID=248454 RepID=A0A8S9Y9V9_APOLU|nr:hypothetical protein GE061_001370 [Apolygus lucorum]
MYREEKERGNVGPLLGEAPLDVSFAPLHPVIENDDANPLEATAAAEKPNPDGHLDSHNSFHGPEPCMNGCGGQLSDLQMLSSQSNEDSGDRMDGHGGHSLHLRQSSQSKQASPKLPNASLSPKGMIKKKLELMELDLDSVISDPATNPSKWFVETMRKDPSCEQSFSDLYDSLMLKLLHELGREVNMRFKPQQKLESLDCVNGLQSSNPAATDNISGASRRTSELEKICNSLLSKLPKTDVDPDGRSEPKQKSALLNVDHQSPIPNQVTQPAEGPIQTITLDLSFFHNLAFETRQKSSGSSLTHKLDEHIDRHILDEDLHGRRSDEHIDRHRSEEDVEKRSEPQGKPELFNVGASSPIPHQVTRPAGSANQTVTLDLSFFHNLRRTTCEKPVKSSLGRQIIPRGILHVKEKSTSCDEVIQRCNESLCSQSSLRSLESKACQAFQPICFDEFFMGGCWKTACRAEHYNLPVTTKWVWDVVWEGTIYLIRKATKPRIDVLRLLLQFIFDHSPVCALALAKFIPIMKQTEILEFAHCLVTKLSGFFGGEDDTVKLVLLMIYSDVPSELLFNMLLEHFKIFEKKCTFYLELLHFLNYRCHVLAFGLVEKLIENVMLSESDELIHVVAAFLDRLPSYEKAKIDSTSLSCFMLKAKELKINIGGRVESSISSSIAETLDPISSDRCKKGRVSFAEQPRIARIDDQSHSVIREDPIPAPHQLEIQQPDSAFLDNCIEMDFHPLEAHEINPIVVDPSPFDYCIKSVVAVMKSICLEWILYGICNIGEVCDKMHCFFEDHFASVSEEELIIACTCNRWRDKQRRASECIAHVREHIDINNNFMEFGCKLR